MNGSPDRKKVATFLFSYNYMQSPWRLDDAPAPRPSTPARREAPKPVEGVLERPYAKRRSTN